MPLEMHRLREVDGQAIDNKVCVAATCTFAREVDKQQSSGRWKASETLGRLGQAPSPG